VDFAKGKVGVSLDDTVIAIGMIPSPYYKARLLNSRLIVCVNRVKDVVGYIDSGDLPTVGAIRQILDRALPDQKVSDEIGELDVSSKSGRVSAGCEVKVGLLLGGSTFRPSSLLQEYEDGEPVESYLEYDSSDELKTEPEALFPGSLGGFLETMLDSHQLQHPLVEPELFPLLDSFADGMLAMRVTSRYLRGFSGHRWRGPEKFRIKLLAHAVRFPGSVDWWYLRLRGRQHPKFRDLLDLTEYLLGRGVPIIIIGDTFDECICRLGLQYAYPLPDHLEAIFDS